MTEPGTRSSQIVWRELGNSEPLRVFLDNVPDYFFSDLHSPNSPFATNVPEDFSLGDLRYRQPVINGVFYPIWHWDRPDVPTLSYRVNNCPMIFAAFSDGAHTPGESLESRDPSFPSPCSCWEAATASEPHPPSANSQVSFPASLLLSRDGCPQRGLGSVAQSAAS